MDIETPATLSPDAMPIPGKVALNAKSAALVSSENHSFEIIKGPPGWDSGPRVGKASSL